MGCWRRTGGVPAAPVPAHRAPRPAPHRVTRDVTAVPVGRSPTKTTRAAAMMRGPSRFYPRLAGRVLNAYLLVAHNREGSVRGVGASGEWLWSQPW